MKITNGQIERIEKDGFVYCNVPVQYAIEQNLVSENDVEKYFKEEKIFNEIEALNEQRDKELKLFIVDNIEINEDIIYKMSVKYNTTSNTDKIKWIDADNKVVEFSKADFGALIKKGTDKIEEIYFRYRQLKDEVVNS